jgi:adenylosuccinate lyase
MRGFIAGLDIPQAEKDRLLAMTPATYTGMAAELAKRV